MRRHQRGVAELLFYLVVLAVIAAMVIWLGSSMCSSRWAHSGLVSKYGPIQGCLVQTADGRWVPDDRVREVDVAAPARPASRPEIPRN